MTGDLAIASNYPAPAMNGAAPSNPRLQAALEYAERGWHVFPVHAVIDGKCTCRKPTCDTSGKHPIPLDGFKSATTDASRIESWWRVHPNANVAVRTGTESGIVVVDIDDPELLQFASLKTLGNETLTAQTQRDGRHFVFSCDTPLKGGAPWKDDAGDKVKGLDVRAQGGYVLVWPSTGAKGKWSWLNDLTPAPAPEWLTSRILPTDLPRIPTKNTGESKLGEGGRNTELFRIASAMKGRGETDAAILAEVLRVNGEKCNPPLTLAEIENTIMATVRKTSPDVNAAPAETQPNRTGSYFSKSDGHAFVVAKKIQAFFLANKARYLQGDDGGLYATIGSRRIPLLVNKDDRDQLWLIHQATGLTMRSDTAQKALDIVLLDAAKNSKSLSFRYYSALSKDRSTLYVPLASKQLAVITADSVTTADNGVNAHNLWVEHPESKDYSGEMEGAFTQFESVDPKPGLAEFERLLVATQSAVNPALKWFAAMHEGLLPFLRDACSRRAIVIHIGAYQSGKTTAAERFTRFHGLGSVKFDWSTASLNNSPEQGLLVLDNKESANFNRGLIDFLLRQATGGTHARSTKDGDVRGSGSSRNVVVLTSIEGVPKEELKARCAFVDFFIPRGQQIDNARNEFVEIAQRRDQMFCAIVPVLQAWLRMSKQPRRVFWSDGLGPIPQFNDHLSTLAELLYAFAEVSGKGETWAAEIVAEWERALVQRKVEEAEFEHPWEEPIISLLESPDFTGATATKEVLDGVPGKLYVTRFSTLCAALRAKYRNEVHDLPTEPAAISRRLYGSKFQRFTIISDDPRFSTLKRTKGARKVGFFVPDED